MRQPEVQESRRQDAEQRRRQELANLILDSVYLDDPVSQVSRSRPTAVRRLPPGRVCDLYHIYVASMVASGLTAASAPLARLLPARCALIGRRGIYYDLLRQLTSLESQADFSAGLRP